LPPSTNVNLIEEAALCSLFPTVFILMPLAQLLFLRINCMGYEGITMRHI